MTAVKKAAATKAAAARKKPTTIDEYLAPLPADQRAALQHIRELVHTIAPDATETISYDMPSFRLGGRGIIWFGAAAAHCALYGVPAALCAEVPEFDSSGKGTLRFTPAKPLPDGFIRTVVQSRLHKNTAGTT
jgi:uncharacterized protein YdhG (YjbR/CyaY superfamily)